MKRNQDLLTEALNNIMQFLHDRAVCFAKHVENVRAPELKKLFRNLTLSREKMLQEIQAELISRGNRFAVKGTWLGKTHMLFENLKSRIVQGDALSITKEVRRGEGVLIEYYKEALAMQISPELRAKLMKHLSKIEDDIKKSDLLSVQTLVE
jgi:uncharacterized protein (TIGR02284 family)